MWTPRALASERRSIAASAWRVVESQSRVATMKLVDGLDEQAVLETALEASKPQVPMECAGLDPLLATPFRYAPYPRGSRFRRARQHEGCLYCAERVETAVAEAAFYLMLFFLDSPNTRLPRNPQERTAFSFEVATGAALDLTVPKLVRDRAVWTDPVAYGPCQDLADAARAARVEALRYESVRDPERGANIALLSPAALAGRVPTGAQTWWLMLRPDRVDAVAEMPRSRLEFVLAGWAALDARVPATIRETMGRR